jgi:hypothetical protein
MPNARYAKTVVILALFGAAVRPASAKTLDEKDIVTINDNGSWCWFQDERGLACKGKLIVSSVASQGGKDGAARAGNIEVTTYSPLWDLNGNAIQGAGGKSAVAVLHEKLQEDDHDAAGMTVLPDGRFLAMYSKHMNDRLIRYRVSSLPGDAARWEEEKTLTRNANVTYNNLYRLTMENDGQGRLYDFYRGEHYKPNFLTSDDQGKTWNYSGQLIHIAADPQDKMRPYGRYASNGQDTIWFAVTDAHPAEYPATSLYLGCVRGGKVFKPDGTEIGPLEKGAEPAQLQCLFKGDPQNQAWVCQMQLDKDGKPMVAYSVHKNDDDLRYRFYDGTTNTDLEFARAGSYLYKSQEHYTGNVAVDPVNPRTVYFSTNADPNTGEPLISKADKKRHWELFKAVITFDLGPSMTMRGAGETARIVPHCQITAVTQNSSVDNIRPIVPAGDHSVNMLVWLRGTYFSYTRWNMEVVGAEKP